MLLLNKFLKETEEEKNLSIKFKNYNLFLIKLKSYCVNSGFAFCLFFFPGKRSQVPQHIYKRFYLFNQYWSTNRKLLIHWLQGFSFRRWKSPEDGWWWWLHNSVNVLINATKLYILKWFKKVNFMLWIFYQEKKSTGIQKWERFTGGESR